MKAKELIKFITENTNPEDEILFCQDDGSGYTCEMSDVPSLNRSNRDLSYWDKMYNKKFTVVFGG